MARGHADLPRKVAPVSLRKLDIYAALKTIDSDHAARQRVLRMETDFRHRIDGHIEALPANDAQFKKFNTSPFVLMFYSRQKGYRYVTQVEKDIIPAKVFSSMETSAGRMVETVVLPIYDWEIVPSVMHSVESLLDGRRKTTNGTFYGATLKSGPRCLNDEMAQNIGRDVVSHANAWAAKHAATRVEFTYGVLYGTKKQSNKKDWHILRSIGEALPSAATLLSSSSGKWDVSYKSGAVQVDATVRVGIEWWDYLGGPNTWVELCVSLIRACIQPAPLQAQTPSYAISDLAAILDLSTLPDDFNVALLQRSQLEWLLFLARHFCDELV